MASNTSYPRKYISTKFAELGTIGVAAGNVIALSDTDAIYYDIPSDLNNIHGEVIRRKASSLVFVGSEGLPDKGCPEVIYVKKDDWDIEVPGSSPKPHYSSYIWSDELDTWVEISNNDGDSLVKVDEVGQGEMIYFTGSKTSVISDDKSESLVKNPNIYLTSINGVYTLNSDISGNAKTATNAEHADVANVAINAQKDIDDRPIDNYIYGVKQDSTDGHIISLQRGNGEYLPPITTIDTTYTVFDNDTDGLVPKTENTVIEDATNLVLTGSGWLASNKLEPDVSNSAINDNLSQPISDTYIKGLSLSGATLTYTIGNGNSEQIELPIEHYDEYTGTQAGLVPANGGGVNRYLSGTGTWEILPGYAVFPDTEGLPGLVPYPAQGTPSSNVLSASGEWIAVSSSISSENLESQKLFLVGATEQTADSVTPYSNVGVYIEDGVLHSDDKQVATLDGTESLTNKTYEGYVLGNACSKTVTPIISSSTDSDSLPTVGAITSYIQSTVPTPDSIVTVGQIANEFGTISTIVNGDYCMYQGQLYRCIKPTTDASEFIDDDWTAVTVMGEIVRLINSH